MENLNYSNETSKNQDSENSEFQKTNNATLSDIDFKECSFHDFYTDISTKIEKAINENFTVDKKDLYDLIEDRLIFYGGEDVLQIIQGNQQENIFSEFDKDGKLQHEGLISYSKEWFCSECVKYYLRKQILPISRRTYNENGHFVIHHNGSLSDKDFNDLERKLEDGFNELCDIFQLSENDKNNLITDVNICNPEELNKIYFIDFGNIKEEWIKGWNNYKGCTVLSPDSLSTDDFNYILDPLYIHSKTFYNYISTKLKKVIDVYFSDFKKGITDKDNSNFHRIFHEFLQECYGEIFKKIQSNSKNNFFTILKEKNVINLDCSIDSAKEKIIKSCLVYYYKKYLQPEIFKESKKTYNGKGRFIIHHNGSLNDNIFIELERNLEANFDSLCYFFNLPKKEIDNLVTNVYACNPQELQLACLFYFGNNQNSYPFYDYKSLVFWGNNIPPDSIKYYSYDPIKTALHEFVHVVTYLNCKLRQGWISEGVAQYFSLDKTSISDLEVALKRFPVNKEYLEKLYQDNLKQKELDKIQENLDKLFSDDRPTFYEIGMDGYFYAYTIVDYIVRSPKFGIEKIAKIFKQPETSPFDVLGVSKEEFQKGWIDFLNQVYLEEKTTYFWNVPEINQ